MEPLAAPLEQLQDELRRRLPEAKIRFDAPTTVDGTWWADIEWQGNVATVEWRPDVGFGVAGEGGGYGEGPDVVVITADAAADQIFDLFAGRTRRDSSKHAHVS